MPFKHIKRQVFPVIEPFGFNAWSILLDGQVVVIGRSFDRPPKANLKDYETSLGSAFSFSLFTVAPYSGFCPSIKCFDIIRVQP